MHAAGSDDGGDSGLLVRGVSAETDADGSFQLDEVPVEGARLRVRGEAVLSTITPPLAPFARAGERLRIEVARRCGFRFQHSGSGPEPDAMRVLDREGALLLITTFGAHGSHTMSGETAILRGASHAVWVSEDAASLVLLRGGKELARFLLALEPGRIMEVLGP